jgi:3-oxoacyl-[acyl-carrier protein] reductase
VTAPGEPSLAQLRRNPFPLRGRAAVITGVSRRAGIGYAVARRLAALGASLYWHHYLPHDRAQPHGADPGGTQAMVAGVRSALAGAGASLHDTELDLALPDTPTASSRPPHEPAVTWTSWSATRPAAAATGRSAPWTPSSTRTGP